MPTRVFFFVLILFFLLSCRKSKTTWDSDWVLPLFNDSLAVQDYVNDSTLEINPDNSIQVVLDRIVANVNFFDLIPVPDTTISQSFVLGINALPVSPGMTYVNEVQEHEFDLGDVVLKEARVKSGIVTLTVSNPIETMAIFTVELPGVSKNGVSFKHTENVPAKLNGVIGTKTLTLDLSGYSMNLRGESGSDYNILQSRMNVKSDPEGDSTVITNQDVVQFTAIMKGLIFDYAKGYFGSLTLSDTTVLNVEELNSVLQGGLALDDVSLRLTIENGIKAMAQGEFSHVKSINSQNQVVALNHPELNTGFNINPAQGNFENLTYSTKELLFTNDNSSIQEFIGHLGSRYELGYKVVLNPWGNTSGGNDELFPQSRLRLRLQTDFLLQFSTDNLVLRDTFVVTFENEQKLINVEYGSFNLKVENGFPYGSLIKLSFLDENNEVIDTIEASKEIAASLKNNGANEHDLTNETILFEAPQALLLNLDQIKSIVVQAEMSSAYNTENKVYANAQLKMRLVGNFKLKTSL